MLEKTNILGGDEPYMNSEVIRIYEDREGKVIT